MAKRRLFFYALILLIFASLPFPSFGETLGRGPASSSTEKVSIEEIVRQIEASLEQSLIRYRQGNPQGASGLVSDAYFDLFEGRGLEALLAARSPAAKVELESLFGRIIGLMRAGAEAEQVGQEIGRLVARLEEAARELESPGTTAGATLINSFFIILREGFEAILVISALTAYLIKTGHERQVKVVYGGAGWALLASILTALWIRELFAQNPAGQEVMEGATMLLAAGVLFYVSYWLTSKAEAARWTAFIQEKVRRSLSRGSLFALGFTAFLAVYREGAETILFYQALLSSAEGTAAGLIGLGFLLGCAALVGVFFLFKRGSLRIPIRAFFALTGIFLYYLAFCFAGEGITELQVGGVIGTTPVSFVPQINLFRIYPTVESLAGQGALVAAALFAGGYLFMVKPLKRRTMGT